MAKKQAPVAVKEKPTTKQPVTQRHSYMPKKRAIFGIILIILGIRNYIGLNLILPDLVVNILLVLAGLWFLILAIDSASAKRRRNLMKKYI